MQDTNHAVCPGTAAREHDTSLFVALELSRSVWLIAVNMRGSDKISKFKIAAADTAALRTLLARLKAQSERRCGSPVKTICIHEAGLDGFWVDRLLQANGVDSHVVDAASIAVDRRSRRAQNDRIDVQKLVRPLMGWGLGGRRIWPVRRPAGVEHAGGGPACTDGAGILLLRLRSIGPEFASVLSLEAFYRSFANRREIADYAGLVPSPWKSGSIDVEQGISKAGNPRLRKTMIQLAWLWLRHQPGSALSRWFHERVGEKRGKIRRITIVAVARKLLVALWRYVTQGLVADGAALKA